MPGQREADPPLPRGGRQPERPGQDARAKDVIGAREGLADAESAVETRKPRLRRR